jgi:cobalamin biosynthesis protein CobT
MKLALMVGGMAAGRRAGGPGQLLAQGTKLLGQSPELGRLTDEVRGRLIEAGKGAAVAVATRQVEALTDRLVNQLATAPEAGGRVASDVGERAGGVGRTVSGLGRRRSRDEDESDRYDEEEPEEEPAEDRAAEEPEDEPAEAEAEEPAEEPEDEAAEAEAEEPEDEAAEAEAEEPEDEAAEAEEDEEPPPAPRRRPVRTGVGGRRAADGTGRAPGSARTASQAAGGRSGRPARGRQGRSDG